jgi:hypothetical protein
VELIGPRIALTQVGECWALPTNHFQSARQTSTYWERPLKTTQNYEITRRLCWRPKCLRLRETHRWLSFARSTPQALAVEFHSTLCISSWAQAPPWHRKYPRRSTANPSKKISDLKIFYFTFPCLQPASLRSQQCPPRSPSHCPRPVREDRIGCDRDWTETT